MNSSQNEEEVEKKLSKRKVTISLSSDILDQITAMIDNRLARSRSDAIERALREYFSQSKKAVILVGGKKEDIYINELEQYTPLIKIKGRTLIEDTLHKCASAGFNEIIIIGFQEIITQIFSVLGTGTQLGINITYIEEKKPRGVAKTLENAKEYLKSDFLMIPGDCYFDFDLTELQRFHLMHDGVASLVIYAGLNQPPEAQRKGRVKLLGTKIIYYEEKPINVAKTHLLSTLIGFLSPEIFSYIPMKEHCSLQEEVFPTLVEKQKIYGFMFDGDWINIHNAEDINKVKELLEIDAPRANK